MPSITDRIQKQQRGRGAGQGIANFSSLLIFQYWSGEKKEGVGWARTGGEGDLLYLFTCILFFRFFLGGGRIRPISNNAQCQTETPIECPFYVLSGKPLCSL